MKSFSLALMGVLSVLLVACQSAPRQSPAPTREALPADAEAAATRAERELQADSPPALGVVAELQLQAEGQLARGDWRDAIATAEHGLRIDRRHAPFYRVLGEGYRALGQLEMAREFAQQALRFCGAECGSERALFKRLQPRQP